MTKHLYATKKFRSENRHDEINTLEYYIVRNDVHSVNMDYTTYGIEVVKKRTVDGIIYSETKTVEDICTSCEEVIKILQSISKNTVTPISVEYIVNDIMDDIKSEFQIITS